MADRKPPCEQRRLSTGRAPGSWTAVAELHVWRPPPSVGRCAGAMQRAWLSRARVCGGVPAYLPCPLPLAAPAACAGMPHASLPAPAGRQNELRLCFRITCRVDCKESVALIMHAQRGQPCNLPRPDLHICNPEEHCVRHPPQLV